MLIGASWPWNLSTVPTRASVGEQAPDRPDLGVVGRHDEDVRPADRALSAVLVDPDRTALDELTRDLRNRLGLDGRFVLGTMRRHLEQARPGTVEHRHVGPKPLDLETRLRLEPVVVEDLGRERAEVRVEAPGGLEEEPLAGRHRRVGSEHVAKGRPIGAGRMRSAERLIELLRVAQEDDARRRLRHCQDVGERDLARLVDEQHVNRARHLWRRPEPGRARREVGLAGAKRGGRLSGVLRSDDQRIVEDLVGVAALDGPDLDRLLGGGDQHGPQQVPDDLVAVGGDPYPFAARQQRADHPRAAVGLAGTGWTLDRQR